jgi:hypothetical protein
VIVRAGGVVSFGCVVVVEVGALDVVDDGGSVVGVLDEELEMSCVSEASTNASDVVVSGDSLVVVETTRGLVSEIRSARIAEATRAERLTDSPGSAVGAVAVELSPPPDGENAANPTTATRATIRRPAYASGIRGLT